MRADRAALASAVSLALGAHAAASGAQSSADGRVLAGHRMLPSAAFKILVPTGQMRLVAWDRDSVLVRGRVPRSENFFFHGDSTGVKLGVERNESMPETERPNLVIYVPRHASLSVKTVSASVDGAGVSGWFYSVSGSIHLSGTATSIEVESMNGSLDLN